MEPIFALTCYVQLREQFRSSMTPFLETGRGSLPEQGRDQAIGRQTSSQHPMETPNSPALRDPNPGEPVNLENAFVVITEELNFDFPEPSSVDRIKAGLLEATIGALLFVGLLVTEFLLQHRGCEHLAMPPHVVTRTVYPTKIHMTQPQITSEPLNPAYQ